jgi:hypothetical protein
LAGVDFGSGYSIGIDYAEASEETDYNGNRNLPSHVAASVFHIRQMYPAPAERLIMSVRLLPVLIIMAVSGGGCTNFALSLYTKQQIESTADTRYQEALNNLAVFSASPWSLPAYSSIYSGTTKIVDQDTMTSATNLGREAINKVGATVTHLQAETLDISVQRQVSQNWSLDPIASPEKLRAIRGCCCWVLYGPERVEIDDLRLLQKWNDGWNLDPNEAFLHRGHYFDLANDLAGLPPCWLGRGKVENVPCNAVYKAHYQGRWVWVTAENVAALSQFSLLLQKVARIKTDETYFPKPNTRTITFKDATDRGGKTVTVTAYVDARNYLVSGEGAYAEPVKRRLENIGTDSNLRSQINAAGVR